MSTYRTFIAIELPAAVRRDIAQHIDQLRRAFPEVRASWSREDNLHLTLKFLGDVSVTRIANLSEACTAATSNIEPFELVIDGCGTFPPHGRPKVLWVGISSVRLETTQPPLLHLHQSIEDACAAAGFPRESRPYHPHLTIARLRESRDSRTLAEKHRQSSLQPHAFTVSEVILFRSELSSKGAKHAHLSHHQLAKS
jgi:2'-5' RNA ligase